MPSPADLKKMFASAAATRRAEERSTRSSLEQLKRMEAAVRRKRASAREKAATSRRYQKASGRPIRKVNQGLSILRNIKHYQLTTDLLMRRVPFARLVREIANEHSEGIRFQGIALWALQEAAEDHLVRFFQTANLLAIHCKRSTLMLRDMQLWGYILDNHMVGYQHKLRAGAI